MKRLIFAAAFLVLGTLFAEQTPRLSLFSSPNALGEAVARKIADRILEKQGQPFVLGLATGSSPIPVYEALKKLIRDEKIDLSNLITFNLDEYIGLPSEHPQSYVSFMFDHLFDDLIGRGLKRENIHIPKGAADLSEAEQAALLKEFSNVSLSDEQQLWIAERRASEYEALIEQLGPIDLQILGLGPNGHIGFAEPGTPFSSKTMVIPLTEETRAANARFFDRNPKSVPERAITMGIHTILQAKEILLIATGEHKAEIIAKTLHQPISPEIPSTALRLHGNTSFFLDEGAASLVGKATKFYNAKILLDHQIKEGELWISDGKIVEPQPEAEESIDVHGSLIAPGYIDLQINGAFGCDFSRDPEQIERVAELLPQYGVTAFLPTVISSSPEQYRLILPHLQPRAGRGAAILGIHLEGPFFSPLFQGAHNGIFLRSSFDAGSSPEEIYGSLEGVKIVTLAPEIQGGPQLIEQLRKKEIVVSVGHSNATFDQMQRGIEAGVEYATHLFNAMRPYHHRDTGVIGSVLINPSLFYSLILDGVHLSPETLSLCWRCNPKGLILVTDATEALGLPDGQYKLGTLETEVADGRVYLRGTKTIAGSALSLDQAVRHLYSHTNCSIPQALESASLKPAQLIGAYPTKGTLAPGADADFVILSDDLTVQASYIGGKLAWKK